MNHLHPWTRMAQRARSLTLLLALAAATAACEGAALPQPEPTGTPPVQRPAFDGAAAHALLREQVAFGPRVPNTAPHAAQLSWMRAHLAERAETVELQPFRHVTSGGDTLRLTNLLARFGPDNPERVLLLAHWDTRPTADQSPYALERERPIPGANDGASGVAVLMQLAEMLHAQPPTVGVDVLLVDGEDYGPTVADMFLGSEHFAANLPDGYAPRYGVLLDMVGDADLRLPMEGYSVRYAPDVVQRVWSVAADLGYGDIFVQQQGGSISDDHLPLNRAGIPTIDVIDFDYGPNNSFWHTLQDRVEHTSAESLDAVGEVVAELVYRER